MNVVYDAGVLVAADRSDRRIWADHRVRLEAGVVPLTTAPVVAQVRGRADRRGRGPSGPGPQGPRAGNIVGGSSQYHSLLADPPSRAPSQAQLRRFLRGCDVAEFSRDQAHAVGGLLAKVQMSDVVDAHVVVTALHRSSAVLTSDPDDLEKLAAGVSPQVNILPF